MEGRSLKQSLFFGSAVALSVLLVFDLLFMAFYLRQSNTAERQLILAQKILLCAGRDYELEGVNEPKLFPKVVEKCESCKWNEMVGLRLLREGGDFAGKDIPSIENPEIIILLDSMVSLRQARENIEMRNSARFSLAQIFHQKAHALSDALAFRAMAARDQVWITFRFMVALVALGLFGWLLVVRNFLAKERKFQREKHSFGLGTQLLMGLPEALVLLDKSLSLNFVNRLAESYFGRLSSFSQKRNFGLFCQDQSLLNRLQSSLQGNSSSSRENFFAQPEEVLLQLSGGRKCLVVVQWYRLYLVDRNYLLGVIYNPENDRRKELNIEIAQEHLVELSRNLFKAQDDERQHLADELHDGLCQSLAALKMQVYGIERNLDKVELQEECRQARQFIAQIIEDTRRLSHDLSPVILDDLGLSDALAHLVNNFTALHNLKASVAVPDIDAYFSSETSRNIYRIVQEAINNVGKHAHASLLVLEAEIIDDTVCFSIRDDGVGFEVGNTKRGWAGGGLGLASMAQRVRLLSGEFEIISHVGDGCEVKFTLPKK